MDSTTQLDHPAAVSMRNVSKSFGRVLAVDDLSLTVPAGSLYGFIGPNGSGKTTTLRMLLHIYLPDQGQIEVLGETTTRAANDRIGYLPEERGLYKKMTVSRVLAYYAALKGLTGKTAHDAIAHWLERMGLQDWAKRKVETLSKGMAQKVQFISTIVARPRLLILDEPFSGLDPVNLEVIRNAIVELRQSGTTIIFSTHDMSTAEKMCDFIFMIYKGKKVLDGTLDSIQAHYGSDTIRIRTERPFATLSTLPGVKSVRDLGRYQEVRFEGDSQQLLHSLLRESSVQLFEVTRPSLHDIFVRIANPEPSDLDVKNPPSRAN